MPTDEHAHPPKAALRIAVLGAGPAGLATGIRLRASGYSSFTIFEKSSGVGGTWRDNTYPGSGCDIPSILYCFSFAKKTDWTRGFAEQDEILAYFENLVPRFELGPHLRLGTEIRSAEWSDERHTWTITTSTNETLEFDVLVSGLGQLNLPLVPEFEGTFDGPTFHSARWRHDVDLTGRRVAVIGTGASAVQLVPRVAEIARELVLFQRTPSYVIGKPEIGALTQYLVRTFALYAALFRLWVFALLDARFLAMRVHTLVGRLITWQALFQLRWQVRDAKLRARLRPSFALGCKRILISNDYYPALLRDNVRIVDEGIARLVPDGIETTDGKKHEVDVLVYATGFRSTEFLAPLRIRGRDGRRLEDAWRDGAEAYRGVSVSGFPNLFLLYGPNTNLGHNSILYMIERQVEHFLRCLDAMRERGSTYVDVRPEAQREYNETLQRELEGSVWSAGCASWYKTAAGKITNNWSRSASAYASRLRKLRVQDLEFGQRDTAEHATTLDAA